MDLYITYTSICIIDTVEEKSKFEMKNYKEKS